MAAGKGGGDTTNLAGQEFSVQEPPELSIIIVNWNTRDLLRDCLNSVYDETMATSFEVFAADNASSDGSVKMVKKEFPQVRLIENRENLPHRAAEMGQRGREWVIENRSYEVLARHIERRLCALLTNIQGE